MTEVVAELSGVLYDKLSRTSRPVLLKVKGNAMAVDAGEPGDPPHIWGGGNVPMPSPPIANVPGAPGYQPPGDPPHIWGGGNVPMPNPPIYLPPDITPPEPPTSGTKPPPEGQAGWGYYDSRWGYFPAPGEASPKA